MVDRVEPRERCGALAPLSHHAHYRMYITVVSVHAISHRSRVTAERGFFPSPLPACSLSFCIPGHSTTIKDLSLAPMTEPLFPKHIHEQFSQFSCAVWGNPGAVLRQSDGIEFIDLKDYPAILELFPGSLLKLYYHKILVREEYHTVLHGQCNLISSSAHPSVVRRHVELSGTWFSYQR